MNSPLRIRHKVALLSVFPATAGASTLPPYLLQPVPAPTSFPNGINSSGVVVGTTAGGWSYVATADAAHGLDVRNPNTGQFLTVEVAWRINDAGTVTGEASGSGQRYTFVQSATSTDLLPDAGIGQTYVQDMNNAGAIVGDYWNGTGPDAGTHAFLYANHTFTRLGSLNNTTGANGPNFSIATAINDTGVITGVAQAPDGSYPAFVYRDGAFNSIGTPAGYSTALPRAINNVGTIVGEASNVGVFENSTTPPIVSGLFTYDGEHYTVVSSPGGRIMPVDLNSAGDVVGVYYYRDAAHASVSFIYHDGIFTDISTLIDPSSGWTAVSVVGINDSGQMVGQGRYQGQTQTFLLTPLPEPAVGGGLVILLTFAAGRRRTRRLPS